MKKRVFKIFVSIMILVSVTGCVTTPYYGGGYGAGVYGGGYATTYPYQPAIPMYHQPIYGVYDPFLGFGSSVVQGVGLGLGWSLINGVFGHSHHHH